MNTGQISQGLRSDILALAEKQGINVNQMLQSGTSFMDIMLMIINNQQNMNADLQGMSSDSMFINMAPENESVSEQTEGEINSFGEILQILNSKTTEETNQILSDEKVNFLGNEQVNENNQNSQDMFFSDPLSQKFTEIFGIISPEIYKNSSGNNSVDIFAELNKNNDVKDSFDFSESMLQIDPQQLAGLLDFISTGNGIPMASDISDNALFKTETVENISSVRSLFNPEEMIKSGEMEIVSYTPAENNPQSSSNQQTSDNNEQTIDFARTMKSVKENVKTENNNQDDTFEFEKISAQMISSNPDDRAEKIDISFDRAYAELEMNKAKYGSADEQLYKGISENLKDGRSEFTVKLRPEGLGEILVKLVSDESGKAVLSMIASSEKTAELLNRDIAALQSSLNNHNVEIKNSTVKTAETVMHAETAFDQYDERRQEEANQQNHFRRIKNKIGKISDKNGSFEAEDELIVNSAVDSALNITI